MAGYNTIRGLRVKYLSADPAASEDGQVWYNSTTGNLRVDGMVLAASWASGAALNTARQATSAAGNMSAMFASGGGQEPAVALNEEYNGSDQ